LLCCEPRTEETEGSQIRVTRRVKAAACLALSWCFGENSQGGGEPKCLSVLAVLCGSGVKRRRSKDCITWTTRWKWPWSFRRWCVSTACKRRQRWRYIVPEREGWRAGLLREQRMVMLPRVVSMLNWLMERPYSC
jgi:hypothetical protein